ncbi:FHA domain-containing protein [Scytonema sp. PCC 10023]|uniref:FHA domain-containing protein n=1 Tax=Scytonema sp. PCC 10023 TaxID=1680591 RepID=UPI0039C69594
MTNDFYLLLTDLNGTIRTIKLNLQKYIIGRNSSCDICINANFISRFHCTLILQETAEGYCYTLWDGIPLRNASTGGTFLNGNRIDKPTRLKTGDIINFAKNQNVPCIQFVVEQPTSHEETLGFEFNEAEA